jgi:hypothetical protein
VPFPRHQPQKEACDRDLDQRNAACHKYIVPEHPMHYYNHLVVRNIPIMHAHTVFRLLDEADQAYNRTELKADQYLSWKQTAS